MAPARASTWSSPGCYAAPDALLPSGSCNSISPLNLKDKLSPVSPLDTQSWRLPIIDGLHLNA